VFDGAFVGAAAGAGAGELEADARGGDDGDQPGALAVAVRGQPAGQVESPVLDLPTVPSGCR